MNWYKNNKQEWKQIIETVASETKRSNQIVEKDIIQSMFLYELSKEEIPLQIIVETSYYLTAFPCENLTIHNYVTDFCNDNHIKLLFEFLPGDFKINVQSLERTFIDKVFAVCDYYLQDMQERDSRHLYDIAKLLAVIKLDDSLKPLI